MGTTHVVAVMASLGETGKIDIHGLVTTTGRGMQKGAVKSVEDAARAVDTALRHLSQETNGKDVTNVVLTVSGTAVEGSNVQGFKPIIPGNRSITNQDVMEVVNHSKSGLFPPDRVQIQTIPREFGVDDKRNIHHPVGMTGSKLEVISYIVTGKTKHVEDIQRAVTLNGRNVQELVYAPLASGICVINQKELKSGALVIDIGGSKTDIAIFANGSIGQGMCIPIGGNTVTNDLSQLLNTSPEEAERLKIQFGKASSKDIPEREAIEIRQLGQAQPRPMQRRVLCEIIESRLRELAGYVQKGVEKSGYWGALPGGIILTGGTAQTPLIAELFSEALAGMPVRIAEPTVKGSRELFGLANAIGAAQFVLQSQGDLTPISASDKWQDRVKGIWGLFGGKS
jgi:cell division protein FtsA